MKKVRQGDVAKKQAQMGEHFIDEIQGLDKVQVLDKDIQEMAANLCERNKYFRPIFKHIIFQINYGSGFDFNNLFGDSQYYLDAYDIVEVKDMGDYAHIRLGQVTNDMQGEFKIYYCDFDMIYNDSKLKITNYSDAYLMLQGKRKDILYQKLCTKSLNSLTLFKTMNMSDVMINASIQLLEKFITINSYLHYILINREKEIIRPSNKNVTPKKSISSKTLTQQQKSKNIILGDKVRIILKDERNIERIKRKNQRHTLEWSRRGFYRHYKNGKVKWIEPKICKAQNIKATESNTTSTPKNYTIKIKKGEE